MNAAVAALMCFFAFFMGFLSFRGVNVVCTLEENFLISREVFRTVRLSGFSEFCGILID